jgi:hypothetical protein
LKFKISQLRLLEYNNISEAMIFPGMVLLLPLLRKLKYHLSLGTYLIKVRERKWSLLVEIQPQKSRKKLVDHT